MKTNFLSRNALPRGSGQFLKGIVTLTILCFHLVVYGQPTLIAPADGSNVALPVTLEWNNNAPIGVTKIEISECGPGTVANTINLDDYVEAPQSPLTLNALEISGVTYNYSTGQLIMVSDRNFIYIPDFANSANDRIIDLTGFQDTEGIVHIGGTRYAVTEERKGEIVFFDIYSNTTEIDYDTDCDIVELSPLGGAWEANNGLEGVSYNPVEDKIHTVKEIGQKGYYTFPGTGTGTIEPDVACDVALDPFYLVDVAGIHHLGLNDLSFTNLSPDVSNHVLLLSQESKVIVETDGSCTEYGRLCLPTDSNLQLEGVTMDNNGNIYVVSEVNDANDNPLNSRLYIYSNPNFNAGNSRKIVYTDILGAEDYEVPQGVLQEGVEYCWRTSTLIPSLCTWSDMWSFTPCSFGAVCNDNNPCTINDVYDSNCDCVGTFQDTDGDGVCDTDDVCPNFDDNLIGTACDDFDDCTIGDTYDSNCDCVGTFQDTDGDGVCDADDTCPGGDDNIDTDGDGIPDDCDDDCPIDLTIYDSDVSGDYEAANTITTDENTNVLVDVSEQLTLNAGYSVWLSPGFRAACGSTMRAHIEGCEPISEKVEQSISASVKCYPNPFRDEVTLEFNTDVDVEAQVIISDVNGKMVTQLLAQQIHRGTQTIDISTENWIPGIYFYQVQIHEKNTGISSHSNGTLIKM